MSSSRVLAPLPWLGLLVWLGGGAAAVMMLQVRTEWSRWAAAVGGAVFIAGVVSFAQYAADKSRARRGRRRIAEARLHAVDLLGGWAAALAARRLLRHKTRDRVFRLWFWVTVVVNLTANAALFGWALARG